jgi:CBS domain containing-hemolysin-like protein
MENAEEMIEGLIKLHDIRVSEIMTPRIAMVTLKGSDSIETARKLICEQQHSRVPVRGDNNDQIIGVLYAKDLLPFLADRSRIDAPIASLALRHPAFVPESKPVDILLEDFRRTRMHIAIVVDEFGGVAGLVTMEDILEEIIGEIADEYDDHEFPVLVQTQEDVWEVGGRVRIEQLNEVLGTQFPEDVEYETLAGYIFHLLGRPPIVGDVIPVGSCRFQVLEVKKHVVERVRVERMVPDLASQRSTPE